MVPPRWFWRLAKANRKRFPEPVRRAADEMGGDRYFDRLRVKLEAMDRIAFGKLLQTVMEQQPVTDRLDEIRCPTLVIVGDQDDGFLLPSRELADGIRDAKFVVIKDAHHCPQIEARDAWLEAIGAHLDRARA